MNILITGIHGFVGTNLVKALKANHTIYGLDIVSPEKEGVAKTFSWTELNNLPPIDVIIHLAGKAHDTKNQTNAQVYFDINTGLTQKIYDWFLSSQAQKFVFFSSVKAAADRVEGDFLTEDVTPTPRGPYGESKIAAENYLLAPQPPKGGSKTQFLSSDNLNLEYDPDSYRGQNTEHGTIPTRQTAKKTVVRSETRNLEHETLNTEHETQHTYILRPCMIHGPGNKGNLNLLYQVVKKGVPYPLGAFENRRSFCSVDNLSFVLSELIDKDIPSGIYNVGDDESLSTNELIALMAKVMHKPNRIWKWNKTVIEAIARVGTVIHLPLNTERLQKLTENYVVSNAKLKLALGIKKMPVSAEEGFQKTIESFNG